MLSLKLFFRFISHQEITRIDTAIIALSIIFILFIILLLRDELQLYIREANKNETLCRIGLNAGNFLHNLHLATLDKLVLKIREYNDQGDHETVNRYIGYIQGWTAEKVEIRNNIIRAIQENKTTEPQIIDLHKTIDALLECLRFDQEVIQKIKITRAFSDSEILIAAVPFEITFMLQNIMLNAIEAMLLSGTSRHTLKVGTATNHDNALVTISDSGPGFPVKNAKLNLHSKKLTGGYGITYIKSIIGNYNGTVDFSNDPAGGAVVTITLPVYKEEAEERAT